jgi:hypothetical protein
VEQFEISTSNKNSFLRFPMKFLLVFLSSRKSGERKTFSLVFDFNSMANNYSDVWFVAYHHRVKTIFFILQFSVCAQCFQKLSSFSTSFINFDSGQTTMMT